MNCDQRADLSRLFPKMTMQSLQLPCPFEMCHLPLMSSGSGVHFSSLLIWAGPETCLDQENAVEVTLCDFQA